jgi:hypothetical protein
MVQTSFSLVPAVRGNERCEVVIRHHWRVTSPLPRACRREHLHDVATLDGSASLRLVDGAIVDSDGVAVTLRDGDREYVASVLSS